MCSTGADIQLSCTKVTPVELSPKRPQLSRTRTHSRSAVAVPHLTFASLCHVKNDTLLSLGTCTSVFHSLKFSAVGRTVENVSVLEESIILSAMCSVWRKVRHIIELKGSYCPSVNVGHTRCYSLGSLSRSWDLLTLHSLNFMNRRYSKN